MKAGKEMDCRGLACPGPVLRAKNLIEAESPTEISVMVDNEAAVENVSRFLKSRSYEVSTEPCEGGTRVTGRREGEGRLKVPEAAEEPQALKKILVLVSNDRMGHGDDELGRKLLASFLSTLKEMGKELWRLVFINNGVKLAVEGSEFLSTLKELERDTTILVCGTCLNHFGLLEKKKAGTTTNMLDIVTAMQLADKVITL
jgi:selenium metabolism protein YedF